MNRPTQWSIKPPNWTRWSETRKASLKRFDSRRCLSCNDGPRPSSTSPNETRHSSTSGLVSRKITNYWSMNKGCQPVHRIFLITWTKLFGQLQVLISRKLYKYQGNERYVSHLGVRKSKSYGQLFDHLFQCNGIPQWFCLSRSVMQAKG